MDDYKEFLPYIDVNGGLGRLMNNKKLYAKLLRSYLASTSFESMAEPLAAGDLEAAQEKVHTFKGVSANLSLTKNFELSRDLEMLVKENGACSSALELLKISIEATTLLINKAVALLEV